MNLLQNFISFIHQKKLFTRQDRLLIAVSGGVDSVVLCDLCFKAQYNFAIAHCNFQLRGEESERDETFVKQLGEKYGVKVFAKKFSTLAYAEQHHLSIQVAARKLRYEWFYNLVEKMIDDRGQKKLSTINYQLSSKSYILTAHHANDNIETLLMNFFKGTGIQGLKGIEVKSGENNQLVRPLLFAKRSDIETYAIQEGLQYVTDSSNNEDKYTRNYFRNQLIAAIQQVFPKVEDNLIDNIARFNEIAELYGQAISLHKKKLIHQKGNEIHIPVLQLLKANPLHTILYEIIKEYGFTASQIQDVVKLLKSESGKYVQSSSHRILHNRNWLIISPLQTLSAQNILIENEKSDILFEQGKLSFQIQSKEQFKLFKDDTIAQLDADKIKFPLLLRKWKAGDYFYPLGMLKKKKLSRFFIDKKLSLLQKENIWIVEMDKKIIWVAGLRIDDRFKITPNTQKILSITLSPQ